MKRKIAIVIYIFLITLALIFLCSIAINNIVIKSYNKGQYLENQAELLTYINFQKSYVANYNYGNILYQNGEYEKAIEEYKKALKTVFSFEKECTIRINYALSICKTVQVNETNQESISNAIETYESAIEVLTENDCDTYNQDAKTLKEDIQAEIDRLKSLQTDTENKQDDNEQSEEENNEEDIEEKIQNIKEEAIELQREKESTTSNYNKSYSTGKNW